MSNIGPPLDGQPEPGTKSLNEMIPYSALRSNHATKRAIPKVADTVAEQIAMATENLAVGPHDSRLMTEKAYVTTEEHPREKFLPQQATMPSTFIFPAPLPGATVADRAC